MEALSRAAAAALLAFVFLAGCGGGDGAERGAPLVATLGDSITAGSPLWSPNADIRELIGDRATIESQWQYWADRELDEAYGFRNCGVEGELTAEMARRLDECAQGAEVMVIQGGTNDIVQDIAPAIAAKNIARMIRTSRDLGLRTLVTTVPPLSAEFAAQVGRLNELIGKAAKRLDVPVIPFFDALQDPKQPNRLPPRLTDDGVHPTIEGYGRLGKAAAAKLAR